MVFLNIILYVINSFQLRLLAAEVLFCLSLPPRKYSYFFVGLGACLFVALPGLIQLLTGVPFYNNPSLMAGSFNFSFILVFVFSLIMIALCFKVSFSELLFLGAGAYVIQNLMYDSLWLIKQLFFSDAASYLTYDSLSIFNNDTSGLVLDIMSVFIIAAGYAATYFAFIRHWARKHRPKIDSKFMIVFLFATLLLLNYISWWASDSAQANIALIILLIATSVLLLIIQFGMFERVHITEEKEIAEHIARAVSRQQQMSKETIELINIKSHDLKRSLAAIRLENDINAREKSLQETEKAIESYDSLIKTGNHSLDIILTEKKLFCESNKIEFTYIVDGQSVEFIDGIDIYILLGNALDNAIESVMKEDECNRIITVNISRKNLLVLINIENYCSREIKFIDGLPQTTKGDKSYHGFGVRSIVRITEKYKGNFVARQANNRFLINIIIPVEMRD